MKYLATAIIFFGLYSSCISNVNKHASLNYRKVNPIIQNTINSDTLAKYDTVNISKFLIKDNKIFLSEELFKSVWKSADSVKTVIPDCGYLTEVNSVIKEYHFNGVTFLTYNDYAELVSIDFSRAESKLYYPEITLSSETKIKAIKEIFPNSYDLREQYNAQNNVRVRLSLGEDIDQYIILDFKNEKLINLEIWSPC